MPLPKDIELAKNQFALHFETNEQIDAGQLGRIFNALAVEADRFEPLQGKAHLTVRSLKSGSPTSVIIEVVYVMAALSTIGAFVLLVVDRIARSPSSALARRVAELMEDNGVAYVEVARNLMGKVEIVRLEREHIPAVQEIRSRREQMNWHRYFYGRSPRHLTADNAKIEIDSAAHAMHGDEVTFEGGEATWDRATWDNAEWERGEGKSQKDDAVRTTEDGSIRLAEDARWKRPGVHDLRKLADHAFDPTIPFPITGEFVPVAGSNEVIFVAGERHFRLDENTVDFGRLPVGDQVSLYASIDPRDPTLLHVQEYAAIG